MHYSRGATCRTNNLQAGPVWEIEQIRPESALNGQQIGQHLRPAYGRVESNCRALVLPGTCERSVTFLLLSTYLGAAVEVAGNCSTRTIVHLISFPLVFFSLPLSLSTS